MNKWYLDRHKIASEFNPKVIIEATLNNTVDDMIGVVAQLGLPERQKEIEKLRDKVVLKDIEISKKITDYWGNCFGLLADGQRREFADYINEHIPKEYRSIMFKLYDGKNIIDIKNKLVYNEIYNEVRNQMESE